VPEPPAEPITRLGDLWLLGNHRLLCGDATSDKDVARLMNKTKAGAVLTDPPYGIGIDGQKESICADPKHNRKAHEFMGWDSDRPPKTVFERIVGMQCPTAIFGGNYFADMLPPSRGWVYWDKGQDGLTMSDGELVWTNTSKPLRCVTVNRGALRGSVHPTQKPADVVAFVVKYLEPNDGPLVDLFLGSGTTLIVAEQLGRDCYGIEMEPKYCDAIVKRWEEFTGQKAVRPTSEAGINRK
jgi:DNA modification methylase